jgi:DNA-binding NtrC family response regulator
MRQVYKEIGLVAAQDFPVIITGESGTGKELAARATHEHSNRAGRPPPALNAAAIPEALLELELFGREKDAFSSQHKAASPPGIARQTLRVKLREQGLLNSSPGRKRR